MAATRLRKTFQYPADNSEEDEEPRDMDEEGGQIYRGSRRLSTDTAPQSRRN